jgi:hypothetical protein
MSEALKMATVLENIDLDDMRSDHMTVLAAVENAAAMLLRLAAENAGQAERIAKLEEALTPSGDTKAAYMGEFSFPPTMRDDDGDEFDAKIPVPWTTIKEIMAAIKARAALGGDNGYSCHG